MDKKNVGKKISKRQEEEMRELIAKADQVKGEQLLFTESGEIEIRNELQELTKDIGTGSIQDPEKMYERYYKGIQSLLKRHLPAGKEYAKARDYIYEEKNVYLTRGKRKDEYGVRHADSRMGYYQDAEEMLKIISSWILKNGTMVELYNTLIDLNLKMGYGKRIYY